MFLMLHTRKAVMLLVFFMTAAIYVLIACIIADDGTPVFKLLAASGLSHVTLLLIAGDSMPGMAAIFVLALLGPAEKALGAARPFLPCVYGSHLSLYSVQAAHDRQTKLTET